MIMFSATQVATFVHRNKSLRYGQAFHQFMKLEKIVDDSDKRFCDRLYNAIDEVAKQMIASRLDKNN